MTQTEYIQSTDEHKNEQPVLCPSKFIVFKLYQQIQFIFGICRMSISRPNRLNPYIISRFIHIVASISQNVEIRLLYAKIQFIITAIIDVGIINLVKRYKNILNSSQQLDFLTNLFPEFRRNVNMFSPERFGTLVISLAPALSKVANYSYHAAIHWVKL